MLKSSFIKVFFFLCLAQAAYGITWLGNWAKNCDFPGNDLSRAVIRGEDCAARCKSTPGCTHFSWTRWNGGTCFMKRGGASKSSAVSNSAAGSVCGVNPNAGSGNTGSGNNGLGGNDNFNGGSKLTKGRLIWQDEFNSMSTLRSQWNYDIGGGGFGNNEKQYYTDRNAYVSNSILTIEAKKENYGGSRYTATKLKSKKNFRYGVFEMRAKLPRGRGTWPAFWLLSAKPGMRWPNDGEIDIMEHVGYDFGRVHGTIHCGRYNHIKGTQKGGVVYRSDVADTFHLYQLRWTPNSITVYFDNEPYFKFNNERNGYDAWPFDNEHYMILNFAVGGNWGGAKGIDDGIFPQKYQIDYVRVYEL